MKFILTLILSLSSFSAFADYVEGDGTLDYICIDKNTEATPHNTFLFKMFYDDSAPMINFAYQVSLMSFPFYGAEILPVTQVVPGCEFAQIQADFTNPEDTKIYFECNADGDAGFGNINVNLTTEVISGDISFPEGQPTLGISEGSKYELSCNFNF